MPRAASSSTADQLVNYANGSVWDNYPGAAVGGTQHSVNFTHWLTPGATTLTGPNTHVYSDVNDDNAPTRAKNRPSRRGRELQLHVPGLRNAAVRQHDQLRLHGAVPVLVGQLVPAGAAVLHGQTARGSWRMNRAQNGTQVFFFVNNFHDHLAAAPIGFTDAAGNFEA